MGSVKGGIKSHIGTLTAPSTSIKRMSIEVPSRCIFTLCGDLFSLYAKLVDFDLLRKF